MNVPKEILHWCNDMKYVLACRNRQSTEYIANKWRMQVEAEKRRAEIVRLRNG